MENTNSSSGLTFDSFEFTTFETSDALFAYVNNLAYDSRVALYDLMRRKFVLHASDLAVIVNIGKCLNLESIETRVPV